ncbi:MAG: class I SAM-dependent methyltransferase [Acidobacteriota bacterium]
MNRYQSVSTPSLTASFRDPSGCLIKTEKEILRIVSKAGRAELELFLASATAKKYLEMGSVVQTEFLEEAEIHSLLNKNEIRNLFDTLDGNTLVKHEKVLFASFPYEWPVEMLHTAATLTLDLAESLISEGLGLKDATPYNILFRGPAAVFVDLLSFEQRAPTDPIWLACAQFERTFLLPLLMNKYFGLTLTELFIVRRDGIEPEEIYRMAGLLRRLMPPFLTMVSLPVWLTAKHNQEQTGIYQQRSLNNPEKARFILESSFKRLRHLLEQLAPKSDLKSSWSDYISSNNYSEEHFKAKTTFVEQAIAELSPGKILDVGCNTGHFSAIAARSGATVVAIDSDPVVVGKAWRRAISEHLDILPLVIDLSRPSPSIGWRNRECASFLERARGAFDAILMLAVVHHLLVSERIPLPEIIDLVSELTTDILIIEYIAPNDSMFRKITRGREHLFEYFTREFFENICAGHFNIVRVQHLNQTERWLYLLRKRKGM